VPYSPPSGQPRGVYRDTSGKNDVRCDDAATEHLRGSLNSSRRDAIVVWPWGRVCHNAILPTSTPRQRVAGIYFAVGSTLLPSQNSSLCRPEYSHTVQYNRWRSDATGKAFGLVISEVTGSNPARGNAA